MRYTPTQNAHLRITYDKKGCRNIIDWTASS